MLPFAFEDGMGFQAYVDWVLDVPMYFVYRDGKYINALGQSFRDFLKGQLPALPGEKPTLSDWADHMTTVFPEARAKKFIEMRGADCGDQAHIAALPAFWVGLMYDQTALDAAWDLVKGLDAETREGLRVAASVSALQGEAGGREASRSCPRRGRPVPCRPCGPGPRRRGAASAAGRKPEDRARSGRQVARSLQWRLGPQPRPVVRGRIALIRPRATSSSRAAAGRGDVMDDSGCNALPGGKRPPSTH
jgi:hypothetical protein